MRETKTNTDAADLRRVMNEFLGAFEAFKQSNDERLEQIEAKGVADVVTREKVDRINTALDDQKQALTRLELAARRPHVGGEGPARNPEHKAAFEAYMRSGETSALTQLESKALSVGSDPDGGYLAPEETARVVDRALQDVSAMRAICSVRQVSATTYRKPVTTTGPASGWVAETGTRPETTSPTLSIVDFPTMELYAMPAATQSLLDDAVVDVEQWLAEEIQYEFALQKSAAFIAGDGTNKPRGFLRYPVAPTATQGWDEIGYVPTGAAGDFPADDPSDVLIDLIYALPQSYRPLAR